MTASLRYAPAQVEDLHDWAVNASPLMNGRADALAHFGKLTRGEWTAEALTGIQSDVLDANEPGYCKGYTETWNVVTALISGVATDDLHNL
jgi:hypothetical protein